MIKKTKELTLKQRLQNLSEAPTPYFHSLTPFAAGFTQGFNYEKKRLVSALLNNSGSHKGLHQRAYQRANKR